MNWKLFVGLRYFARRSGERFISIISVISILGVMVGVAALIVVISIMTGFDIEIKDKIIEKIINKIMKKENVSFNDFIIRSIPELTSEGNERDLFINIKDFEIGKTESDELNKGKKKVIIKFTLEKGSYATNVVKFLFTPQILLL